MAQENVAELPVIAIVGRPNVGKSSLFNAVVGRKLAIVHEMSGVTRDRVSTDIRWQGQMFTLVDTGGLNTLDNTEKNVDFWDAGITEQAKAAMEAADVLIMVCDSQSGLTPLDLDVPQFRLDDYTKVAEFIRDDMGKLPVRHELYGSVQVKLGRKGPESELAFGKGLVDLLEGIDRSGSINHATKEMHMAYSKAWKIINNAEARSGLTLVEREGPGGSKLTKEGQDLVHLYRELSSQAQQAIDDLLAGGVDELE